jgi:hypothetical protein
LMTSCRSVDKISRSANARPELDRVQRVVNDFEVRE